MNELFAIVALPFSIALITLSHYIRRTAMVKSLLNDFIFYRTHALPNQSTESSRLSTDIHSRKTISNLNTIELQFMVEKLTLVGKVHEASQLLNVLRNDQPSKILYYDFLDGMTEYYRQFNQNIEQLLVHFSESPHKPYDN